jgi:hypothetical protein
MAEPVADDFKQIAANLAYIRQQRKEAQDKANAAEALEQQQQRADEPATTRYVDPWGVADPADDAWVSIVEGLG